MKDGAILLVEDNPSDIELTKRALEKNRIRNELIVAEDGKAALDFLFGEGSWAERAGPHSVSVVLLDLKLPKIDGLAVLRQIRGDARTRRLPVVILTTSVEEDDLAASYDLGVNSYIRKPVDFEKFVEAVGHLGLYWLLMNESPPEVTP
ncbi:MAG: response regulator [Thermoanaerobaculia bacterium]